MNSTPNEPRTVTPQEARKVFSRPLALKSFEIAVLVADLSYTVATEPERTRAAMAQAWEKGAKAQAATYGMDKDTGANPYA